MAEEAGGSGAGQREPHGRMTAAEFVSWLRGYFAAAYVETCGLTKGDWACIRTALDGVELSPAPKPAPPTPFTPLDLSKPVTDQDLLDKLKQATQKQAERQERWQWPKLATPGCLTCGAAGHGSGYVCPRADCPSKTFTFSVTGVVPAEPLK